MKKLPVFLVLFALVLAACGGGVGARAATVNGVEITTGDVESLIDSESSAIPKEQFAQFLGFEIQWEIVSQQTTEQWGIEITDDEIIAEADRIYEAASQGQPREDFLSTRGVTEEFLRNIAHQGLLDGAVREELAKEVADPSQEQIDAAMEQASADPEVCVSHILVPTEEEAQDVMDRLDAGEDFGALASELSQDTGSAANNGVLPCGRASGYVAEFRDATTVAPIGEVYDTIVETEFGFHIMLVTDRPQVSEEEIVESLRQQAVGEALNTWFLEELGNADVTVEEGFGTWQTDPEPAVVPPTE